MVAFYLLSKLLEENMKVDEMYKPSPFKQYKIDTEDIDALMKDNKLGLTITKSEVVGETRNGLLLSFKETTLKHKCNRQDVFVVANKYNLKETNEFVGKKVFLTDIKDHVRIKV
jgi:hypothetical protein